MSIAYSVDAKIPVDKRPVHEASETSQNVTPIIYLPLSSAPRFITIRAVYDTPHTALFFAHQNTTQDYFYRGLVDLKRRHMEFIQEEEPDRYKSSFTTQQFSFKPAKKVIQFFDKHRNRIPESRVVGKKVQMLLRVKPYRFISRSTSECIRGLSIQVSEITLY